MRHDPTLRAQFKAEGKKLPKAIQALQMARTAGAKDYIGMFTALVLARYATYYNDWHVQRRRPKEPTGLTPLSTQQSSWAQSTPFSRRTILYRHLSFASLI